MLAEPKFDHLLRMSSRVGLYEHARGTEPRPEHGYCLDDVARGLVVAARQAETDHRLGDLAVTYLEFVDQAQDGGPGFRNRLAATGAWKDGPTTGDHWGRALWGLGSLISSAEALRDRALPIARSGMRFRSAWPRATAYAALGAFEILKVLPGDRSGLALLTDARDLLGRPAHGGAWPWPEPRLTYANAVLAEGLLAVGAGLDDPVAIRDGITLLNWLLELQVRDGHISATPAHGWHSDEPSPGFDQQPIEVAALAEACWRAFEVTGDTGWLESVLLCCAWFLGSNDTGVALYDTVTGGGCDGLQQIGVNRNQGAESTLAALATLQLGHRAALVTAP